MLYRLKGVVKRYGGRTVLDVAEGCLEKGRVLGLLGPNGAGKTTLLEILAFLIPPTSGEVVFDGSPVDYERNLMALRRRVVLVQQHPILFSTTVFENVAFPLKIRKTPKNRRGRSVEELLELVGMEDFIRARAGKLSGGETQRVAIARALACAPEVVLLDEPTASVDVENQVAIERIIRDINERKGISVVFTTHDMIQASRLAHETVSLFEGRMVDSTHENVFGGMIEKAGRGPSRCVLHDGTVLLVATDRSGAVRVCIPPGRVTLSRDKPDSGDGNLFRGPLIQLTRERSRVRAVVDGSIPLSVFIAADEFKRLNPSLGDELWARCAPGCIEVL